MGSLSDVVDDIADLCLTATKGFEDCPLRTRGPGVPPSSPGSRHSRLLSDRRTHVISRTMGIHTDYSRGARPASAASRDAALVTTAAHQIAAYGEVVAWN